MFETIPLRPHHIEWVYEALSSTPRSAAETILHGILRSPWKTDDDRKYHSVIFGDRVTQSLIEQDSLLHAYYEQFTDMVTAALTTYTTPSPLPVSLIVQGPDLICACIANQRHCMTYRNGETQILRNMRMMFNGSASSTSPLEIFYTPEHYITHGVIGHEDLLRSLGMVGTAEIQWILYN